MTQQNETQTELLERTALKNLLECKFLKRLNETSIAH